MAKIPIGEKELGGLFNYDWSSYYYFAPYNTDFFDISKQRNNLLKDSKDEIILMSYEDFKNNFPFGSGVCRTKKLI